MNEERIHRAISADGTEIGGRVAGEGPPLVLVHGAFADGDTEWGAQLPRLTERFTCYTMSTRGRGLSRDHGDHSPERLLEDITAFVDSIGEPVALAGISGGGMNSLGAAARTDAVGALAVYEPVVFEVADEEYLASFRESLVEVSDALSRCRAAEAANAFLRVIANESEQAELASLPDVLEEAGRYAVTDLLEFQHHAAGLAQRSPTAASELERIGAPVLVLHGARTARAFFGRGARHIAEHVADAEVREIAGAGHLGATLGMESIGDEMVRFLGATHPSVRA